MTAQDVSRGLEKLGARHEFHLIGELDGEPVDLPIRIDQQPLDLPVDAEHGHHPGLVGRYVRMAYVRNSRNGLVLMAIEKQNDHPERERRLWEQAIQDNLVHIGEGWPALEGAERAIWRIVQKDGRVRCSGEYEREPAEA